MPQNVQQNGISNENSIKESLDFAKLKSKQNKSKILSQNHQDFVYDILEKSQIREQENQNQEQGSDKNKNNQQQSESIVKEEHLQFQQNQQFIFVKQEDTQIRQMKKKLKQQHALGYSMKNPIQVENFNIYNENSNERQLVLYDKNQDELQQNNQKKIQMMMAQNSQLISSQNQLNFDYDDHSKKFGQQLKLSVDKSVQRIASYLDIMIETQKKLQNVLDQDY
ncbi:hypothetical protein PPERSA_04679 [Pseudocohnilembus persalinus]|uniref:Uncharacterized protein n=1 Tax=Pseudocohnilembus persalinus TaxID=266149 RepID=A0A0V0R4G0_PSEPJ|nr:hypothetical protein PPERSA_04679 [Pseudocohnilembus persalinus]|eukprot:KRX09373.1 hypothetical protein PPERSA_04679 [Pseudocohnilembus persalinus]